MNLPLQNSILGHKPGLFILFFTEMWERFSYYGMRALLVLFLVSEAAAGGWSWSREDALKLYAMYTGLVYITPILGGIIADKLLGYNRAVILGAFLMTCGHAAMAFETPTTFYLGLGLLIFGNGFFKPNISSIVGQLYKNETELKDAAYTIFYMGINAGAFLGILFCGYIGEKVGWSYGFGLAGVFMFFGMLQFYFGKGIFGNVDSNPKEEIKKDAQPELEPHVVRDRLLVIGIFSFFTIFFWMAFEQAGGSMTIFAKDYTARILAGTEAQIFFWINTFLTLAPLVIVTWVLVKLFSKTFGKYSISNSFLGISFVIIWAITGWMINKEFNMKAYELKYFGKDDTEMVTTIRLDENFTEGQQIYIVDLDGKGRMKYLTDAQIDEFESEMQATVVREKANETEVPASWFGILNSFFIILLAPVFSKAWESKFNPSGPVKFGMGLILLGLGFAVLAYGGRHIGQGAQTASVSMWWLVIAYLMHTLGELCISPVGLSYVSKLAPLRLVGLMFGVWFLASAVANYLAGWSASFIDHISETYSISIFFMIYTLLPVIAGLILILLTPFIRKKMHGIY